MTMCTHRFLLIALTTIATLVLVAAAEAAPKSHKGIAAAVSAHADRQAYYGDLHLHTSYSFDSYLWFGPQVDPAGAYRFARGEGGKYLDENMQRSTPALDFAAVTDHAEWAGVLNALDDPTSTLARSELGQRLQERQPDALRRLGAFNWASSPINLPPGVDAKALTLAAWRRTIEAANRYYQPGRFTTFIAYEWTSSPGKRHLHRNVIFRGSKAPSPFTAFDSSQPEDLWRFLETARQRGYDALAIPHNSNMSNGSMFDWVDGEGQPIDRAYAERRASNEPLVEIAQSKGQSETRPELSPNDELASFEVMENISDSMKAQFNGSYVREALGRGLIIAPRAGGINPFKYGFVGASDFHNGLSEAAERAYGGTWGASDPTRKMPDLAEFVGDKTIDPSIYKTGSAGLTGVWAEQNTREAIFAALRRKETFATSGTRLKLRFFGGWDFSAALFKNKDWVKTAYRNGVPMGGDLAPSPVGKKVPQFIVWAAKDPDGANLDRLQVVKVWLKGAQHVEKVYDVVLSDGREVSSGSERSLPIGSTVDLRTATYTNTIGATELATVWQDPKFDPTLPAVYYLRVIEIPTPRWSTLLAVSRGEALPTGVPATIQERGWSSPIWYSK